MKTIWLGLIGGIIVSSTSLMAGTHLFEYKLKCKDELLNAEIDFHVSKLSNRESGGPIDAKWVRFSGPAVGKMKLTIGKSTETHALAGKYSRLLDRTYSNVDGQDEWGYQLARIESEFSFELADRSPGKLTIGMSPYDEESLFISQASHLHSVSFDVYDVRIAAKCNVTQIENF